MHRHTLAVMFTRVKISHLVARLPTSRQQVVFGLLVPSFQQIWNKLLTTCNKLDGIIRLVTSFYGHDITTSMLQGCQHKVVKICHIKHVTDLSEQPCNKSDNFGKVVTSCQQVVPKLLTTCDKQCENNMLTAC